MANVNPYLGFAETTEEAFTFYQSVFGGELDLTRFGDMEGMEISEDQKNLVAHVGLKIGDSVLHGSDKPKSFGEVTVGDNVSVIVDGDSVEHAEKVFNGLAEGGKVTMPIGQAPWAERYGMLTDKFGINWQVNYFGNAGQQG